jgi:signal transduction histidine kinase
MSTLFQKIFEVNTTLVFFAYGLVFFILGLAIALQSRRHSRLELARGLGWLAAFGLVHGFYEWGAVFIPIQASYLAEPAIRFLEVIHIILLALSFAFLFQFGVELLRNRWPKLVALPLLITVAWMLVFFMPGLALAKEPLSWHQNALIWARYLIGFPASICAAFGLRYQADRYIKSMETQHIYRTLTLSEVAFLVYAFFGGLVVPPGSFFPASWLNEQILLEWTGIPVPVLRSLTGLVLTVSIIRALEVFEVEVDQLIEKATLERNLALERERIGRELHDSTIQTIYTAGLLVQSARQKHSQDDKSAMLLERSMEVLNEAIAGLRAYVSDLRPSGAEKNLGEAIRSCTGEVRWTSLIDIHPQIDLPADMPFSAPRTQHVLAIVNEAISNAVRHARAHQVSITAQKFEDRLLLTIHDDGIGFQIKSHGSGYGLRNMRDRARLLSGVLEVESVPGKGTTIQLNAPWEVEE